MGSQRVRHDRVTFTQFLAVPALHSLAAVSRDNSVVLGQPLIALASLVAEHGP